MTTPRLTSTRNSRPSSPRPISAKKTWSISRRELLEQERAEQREKTWATLEEGQIRDGIIRSIKDFGAFVDLGGVDGLLPIGEMSWSRVSKVDEMVKIGDQVKVKVLKIDPVARKLTLGLKQLTPSPWQAATEKYPRGTMVKGKVSKIMDFGAFVELEPGIEGLIHISELSPTRVRRVVDIVKPAQEVEVRILKVEPEVKRIALSLLPDKKAIPTAEEERRRRRRRGTAAASARAQDPLERRARRPRAEKQSLKSCGVGGLSRLSPVRGCREFAVTQIRMDIRFIFSEPTVARRPAATRPMIMAELPSLDPTKRFTGLAQTYAQVPPELSDACDRLHRRAVRLEPRVSSG